MYKILAKFSTRIPVYVPMLIRMIMAAKFQGAFGTGVARLLRTNLGLQEVVGSNPTKSMFILVLFFLQN